MQQLPETLEMGVSSITLSPDASILCVTSLADVAVLWDLSSNAKIAALAHDDSANCCAFVGNTALLTACEDGSVLVWDSRQLASPVNVIRGFKEGVNHMCVSGDGGTLFSACDDGQVYVHSLTGERNPLLDKLWVSSNTVNDLILLEDAGLLLAAAEDCSVKVLRLGGWGAAAGAADADERILASADSFQAPVNHIALHNGVLYAAMSEYLFDIPFSSTGTGESFFGEEANVFEGHEDFIRGIAPLSDSVLLTVSDDCTCIEWSIASHEATARRKLHDQQIMASAVRWVDGAPVQFITGCEGGTVRIWPLPLSM